MTFLVSWPEYLMIIHCCYKLDNSPTVILRKQKVVDFIVKLGRPVDDLCGGGFR